MYNKYFNFSLNVIFGLLFMWILIFFKDSLIIEDLHNKQLDYFINHKLSNTNKNEFKTGNLCVIELNTKINSAITSRKSLSKLIKKVVNKNPRIIFIDIFFNNDKNLDNNFSNVLKDIMENKKYKKIKFILPVKENKFIQKIQYPYFRDKLKKFENKTLFYGISNFYSYGDSNIYRYFNYFKIYDNKKIYNIPLLTKILIDNKQNVLEHNITKIKFKDNEINLNSIDHFVKNRINFYFFKGWTDKGQTEIHNGIDILSSTQDINNSLDNKVVFIGVNNPERGDIYKTPVGFMAGLFILANSYLTLFNPVKNISNKWKYLIYLTIIVIVSYLFTLYNSLKSIIAITISIIGLLYFISYWLFFKYGIFISLMIPLFYISKHSDVVDGIEKIANKVTALYKIKFKKD